MPPLLRLASPTVVAISVLVSSAIHAQTIPDDFVVRLERSSCFGPCPVYTVSIDAKGNVTFEGEQNVRVKGRETSLVQASRVVALLETAERIGFFEMRDQYPDPSKKIVDDLPTTSVTVTRAGRSKRIADCIDAPKALKEFERLIDETARTKRWVRIDEPTLRELLRNGWLPSAEERAQFLMKALEYDDVDVVPVLLEIGADPNGSYNGTHTPPLMFVRSAAAARALLAAGAIPYARNDNGGTPLTWAVYVTPEVTKVLLEAGAPADQAALWHAACLGNIGVVDLLLRAGANPAVQVGGSSPQTCARQGAERVRLNGPSSFGNPPYLEDFDGTIALLEQALAKRPRR